MYPLYRTEHERYSFLDFFREFATKTDQWIPFMTQLDASPLDLTPKTIIFLRSLTITYFASFVCAKESLSVLPRSTENYGTDIYRYIAGKTQSELPVVTKKITFKLSRAKSKKSRF